MPAALTRYARHDYARQPPAIQLDEPESRGLGEILNVIQRRCGHDFSGYKSNTLVRRVRRRMGLRSMHALADYAVLLNAEPAEIDALFKDLLIGVTEFFRDPEAFECIALQNLHHRRRKKAADIAQPAVYIGRRTAQSAPAMRSVQGFQHIVHTPGTRIQRNTFFRVGLPAEYQPPAFDMTYVCFVFQMLF